MSLHISLPQELEDVVHEQVKSGMYHSASEVVRDALRRMFETPSEWDAMDAIIVPRLKALKEGRAEIVGEGVEYLQKLRDEIDMRDGDT